MAAAVVQRINTPAAQQAGEAPPVQRRAEPDGLQTKPLISTIQRVGTKAGTEEEDKDKLAQKKPAGPDHAKKLDEEEDKHLAQKKPAMDAPAMKEPPEEEEEQLPAQRKTVVQRLATGAEPATAQVEGSIKQARGQGRPLPEQFRGSIEQAFGADFSGVRIHTDDRADRLNQAVQARAFTTGQDIFLRPGEYALGSKRGQELLAHELTHVVQQNGSAVQPKANRTAEAEQAPAQEVPQQATATEASNGEASGQQEQAADAAPTSPESDPGFQDVVNQAHGVGAQQKEHPPAEQKSQEAQAAAEPPSNEVESKAQDRQVDAMEAAPTPPFDAPAFKKALMERIAAITPKNLEGADQFKGSNKLESVKNDVTGKVDEAQKGSQGPLEETAKAPPDASGIPAKPVTPLPGNHPGETPSINGAEQAAPKPKGQSQVEAPAQARSQALDQQLADAEITEEQLAKSNEPEFQAALASKSTAQTHSQTAPQAYRQGEQSQLTQAQSTAATTAQDKMQGMHGERAQSLEQVSGKQQEGKGKDEQSRARIAGDIDKIYQETKTKVDGKLSKLTADVSSAFDAGAAEARRAFEGFVAKRMDDYKAARYTTTWSNPFGWANWLRDKLLGMPEEVNRFYEDGRDLYIKQMDGVIDQVVAIVGAGLSEAKNDVAEGRKQVKDYVAKLPEDLKQVGVEAAQNIQSQFAGLEQEIDSKKDELIDTLAQKYKESLEVVDARIKEMQEENKGLIQKAVDAIAGVIKTIIELANLLLQVLARIVDAIGSILKDPIGFLGNLFHALKQGFLNFVKNIGRYLSEGLLSWLTGALAGANIQMPKNLEDSQGIFGMVMGVLGITYEAIRAKAVRRLGRGGEQKASHLEQSFEMFRILATQGVDGVWQVIKDRLGDIKTMVLDPITHFLTTSVIEAGVGLLIGMMTPASAFIRACKAIYDIVKFFIDHAQQLADLINSILDAVGLVASGAIEQASQKVEDTFAKAIPMAIGFMASILGLGNISQRVQALLQKMRRPIDRAIDWVIDQGVKFAKLIGPKLGIRRKKRKMNEMIAEIDDLQDIKKEFKAKDGEDHVLFFNKYDHSYELMLASGNPKTFKKVLEEAKDSGVTNFTDLDKNYKIVDKISKRKKPKKSTTDTTNRNKLMEALYQLAINVMRILPTTDTGELPPSQVLLFPPREINIPLSSEPDQVLHSKDGAHMLAEPLSIFPGNTIGSAPGQDQQSGLWGMVDKQRYVRGHLLNNNVHGPGQIENLTPITRQMNGQMSREVEELVKDWITQRRMVLSYEVTAEYGTHAASVRFPYCYLATKLKFKVHQMLRGEGDKNDWKKGSKLLDLELHHKPVQSPT